jgi:sugar lactone lactonase YvrE
MSITRRLFRRIVRSVAPLGVAALDLVNPASAQTIHTYAGGGPNPNGSGPATNFQLNSPGGLALDAAGNLYIAESVSHRVRRVTPAGIISTVAGTGVGGFSGDGGPATAAQLRNPIDVKVDAAGNLYIVDINNNRIRRVSPAGIITTVAGGDAINYDADNVPATSIYLQFPEGIALDTAGNLYIAQTSAKKIRRVDTNGIITTVAGNGGVGFSGDGGPATGTTISEPYSVAVNAAGEIFFASSLQRIRRVNTAGLINTVAGNGDYGFSGDGGPATSAQVYSPRYVALNSAGHLFIADSINNRVRFVDGGGIITTIAGSGAGGFAGDGGSPTAASITEPRGIAVDANGNVFIADRQNNRVRLVSAATAPSTPTIGTAVAGHTQISVAFTPTSNGGLTAMYTATCGAQSATGYASPVVVTGLTNGTSYTCTVVAFNFFGASAPSTPSNSATPTQPTTMHTATSSAGANGSISGAQTAIWGSTLMFTVTPNAGYFATVGGTCGGSLSGTAYTTNPIAADCTVVATFSPAFTIHTYAGGGATLGDGGAAPSAALFNPYGAALDARGNLYIADFSHHRVRRVTPGGVITTFAGNGTAGFSGDGGAATAASLANPVSVTVDASGNVFIIDFSNNRVRKVNAAGVISTVVGNGMQSTSGDGGPATSASIDRPIGITLDAAGNLYLAESYAHRIRKIDTAGIITTVAGTGEPAFGGDGGPATNAKLFWPVHVAVDGAGILHIADRDNHRIRKVSGAGIITTVAGNGTSGFAGDGGAATSAALSQPHGIAFDTAGHLYIADSTNHRLRRVSSDTGVITTVAGTGTAGFLGDGGSARNARFNLSLGVVADPYGNLFAVDYHNNRIRLLNHSAATAPSTPAIGTAVPASGQISVAFTPGSNGGIAAEYTATCGAQSATGTVSPLIVTGLTNGLSYTCTVVARNFFGVSAASSASNSVTPGIYHTVTPSVIPPVGANGSLSPITPQSVIQGGTRTFTVTANVGYLAWVGGTCGGTLTGNTYTTNAITGPCTVLASFTRAHTIRTIAGGGMDTGDGGAATNAYLEQMHSVAVDAGGNIYFSESGLGRVRKVTPSGVISTVAGTGVPGFSGDGGPATSAELNYPRAVAVDGAGNLYIADAFNNRIRRVNAAGVISTWANEAVFNSGFAIDASGNLYFANAERVHRVSTTGTITTVAGTGVPGYNGDGGLAVNAALNVPSDVAIDGAGNLYIVDTDNNRIRRVNTSGIISTIAGNGTGAAYSGDGSLATSAGLGIMQRVAADGAGNVYVNDILSNRVRMIDTTGIITTLAGNGIEDFTGDGGLAVNASLAQSAGMATDAFGNTFMVDHYYGRIRLVSSATAPATPAIGTAVAGNGQVSVVFTPGGNGGISAEYTATCGALSKAGAASPIIVTGLTNGVSVTCTVVATNFIGASAPSGASNSVTPALTFTVTPSAGANGTITPSAPQSVTSGATSTFTVTPNNGYSASVGGTCGGSLVGASYTTAPVVGNCTVEATFNLVFALDSVRSRKLHGATEHDISIDRTTVLAGNVDVEPRAIGSGHRIVFRFNAPVTQSGSATTTTGSAVAAINPNNTNEVIVTLTAVPDNTRLTVTLTGVNGGVSSQSASIGFLVGDVNNSRSVNATDIARLKVRQSATVDATNFRFDLNTSGAINSADITTVKARTGMTIP